MFQSTGILRYSQDGDTYRLVVEVDPELSRYYRSMIPKCVETNKPRWAPHITVVRPEKEVPLDLTAWGKYEGRSWTLTTPAVFGRVSSTTGWMCTACDWSKSARN